MVQLNDSLASPLEEESDRFWFMTRLLPLANEFFDPSKNRLRDLWANPESVILGKKAHEQEEPAVESDEFSRILLPSVTFC
jgi:hypothetical protein